MSGTVNLKHNGEVVAFRIYAHPADRNKIIETWKRTYGPAFLKAEVEDMPDPVLDPYQRRFKKGDEKLTRGLNSVSKASSLTTWTGGKGLGKGWSGIKA